VSHIRIFGDASKSPTGDTASPARDVIASPNFGICDTAENLLFLLPDLENREKRTNEIVHIINIDVIDNPEDATLGAFMLCELGQKVKLKLNIDFSLYSFIVGSNK
jgi:RNA polymerase II subunit A C-terminal domain phosphatase SSU72